MSAFLHIEHKAISGFNIEWAVRVATRHLAPSTFTVVAVRDEALFTAVVAWFHSITSF